MLRATVSGLVLLVCAGCSGGPSDGVDLGVPDPSVTRPGPVLRDGSPTGVGGDVSGDDPYAPGERVDLGSVDVVLEGPELTQAGVTVAMPGDMDGDGFADMAVANSLFRRGDGTSGIRHALHLVYGTADLDPTQPLGDAPATLLTPWLSGGGGDQPWLASAGDVDRDGLADLLIGVPGFGEVGRAYLLYGSRSRPTGEVPLADVATELTDGVEAGRFGGRVAGLGDLDGDGRDDFGVVAFGNDARGDVYSLHVFYGRRERIRSGATADATIRGRDGVPVGSWLAPAGNVDADQYDDFLVSSNDEPGTRLVRGSNVRLAGELTIDEVSSRVDGRTTTGGYVGDLDEDGFDDFVLGTGTSIVGYLFYGDLTRYRADSALEAASAQLEGEEASTWMSIAAAGDTNGDGDPDFLIGLSNAREQRGAVLLVLGGPARLEDAVDLSTRAVTFLGRESTGSPGPGMGAVHDGAGGSIGAGHDVNGDGLDDFIVSASGDAIGDRTGGRAYVVFGRAR